MVGKVNNRSLTLLAAAALAVSIGGSAAASVGAQGQLRNEAASRSHPPAASCSLGPHGAIKHVIYIQFDNVHYTRDNPNVPSDLQQMPNLLRFM